MPATLPVSQQRRPRWRLSPTKTVLLAMVIGVAVGYIFPDSSSGWHASSLQIFSAIFLRLIKCLIAPLLFATLVVGIAGHGDDLTRVGKLAFRSLLYFEIVTTLALIVGLVAVNLVKPGLGVNLAVATTDTGIDVSAKPTLAGTLEHIVPTSFIDAAARNEALQITFFAVMFAVALSQVPLHHKQIMLGFCESLSEVMLKFVGYVMQFAPIGIGAAMAVTVGRNGLGVLKNLGALVFTLYGALVVFALVVLLPIATLFKVPLRRFWQTIKEPFLIAFTTASSEAALPRALQNLEKLGVPKRIVAFVLPTGYAFNMDGTTLYLAMASIFVAQAAGIHMPIEQQILMMLTLMLTSKGLAAVPRTSLVVLSATLVQFGLPLTGVAVILGVDELMDMARTSLNLTGNCLATVVMARMEGSFDAAPESAVASEPLQEPALAVSTVTPSRNLF